MLLVSSVIAILFLSCLTLSLSIIFVFEVAVWLPSRRNCLSRWDWRESELALLLVAAMPCLMSQECLLIGSKEMLCLWGVLFSMNQGRCFVIDGGSRKVYYLLQVFVLDCIEGTSSLFLWLLLRIASLEHECHEVVLSVRHDSSMSSRFQTALNQRVLVIKLRFSRSWRFACGCKDPNLQWEAIPSMYV